VTVTVFSDGGGVGVGVGVGEADAEVADVAGGADVLGAGWDVVTDVDGAAEVLGDGEWVAEAVGLFGAEVDGVDSGVWLDAAGLSGRAGLKGCASGCAATPGGCAAVTAGASDGAAAAGGSATVTTQAVASRPITPRRVRRVRITPFHPAANGRSPSVAARPNTPADPPIP